MTDKAAGDLSKVLGLKVARIYVNYAQVWPIRPPVHQLGSGVSRDFADEAKVVDVNGVPNVIRLMHFARIGEPRPRRFVARVISARISREL